MVGLDSEDIESKVSVSSQFLNLIFLKLVMGTNTSDMVSGNVDETVKNRSGALGKKEKTLKVTGSGNGVMSQRVRMLAMHAVGRF